MVNDNVYTGKFGLESNHGAQIKLNEQNLDIFNQAVEEKVQEYTDKISKTMKTSEQILEKQNVIDLMPIGSYILVKPYDENPYNKIVVNESGLTLDAGLQPTFKNPDSGEDEFLNNVMKVGTVMEVGPEVKYVIPGDDVYFKKSNMVPIPFFKTGLIVLHEAGIMVVLNEKVSKRWEKHSSCQETL